MKKQIGWEIQNLEDSLVEVTRVDLERVGSTVAERPGPAHRHPHRPPAPEHLHQAIAGVGRHQPVGVPPVDVHRRPVADVDEPDTVPAHEPHPRLEPGDRYRDPSATAAARGPVEVAEGDEEDEAEKCVQPRPFIAPPPFYTRPGDPHENEK